jgi:AcrR family transcriptional regulator
MHTVATEAGVSRSTLYRHFPTRASLEAALRDDALEAARLAIEATVREPRPPLAVLRRLVERLVEVAHERRLDALGASRSAMRPTRSVRRCCLRSSGSSEL